MDERTLARRMIAAGGWRPRHALAVVVALLLPATAMASPAGMEKPVRLPAVTAPTTLSPQAAASVADVPSLPEPTPGRPQSLFPTLSKDDLPKLPAVSLPTVPAKLFPKLSGGEGPKLPKVSWPKPDLPKLSKDDLPKLPDMRLPRVEPPKVAKDDLPKLPKVNLPEMKMPKVGMPKMPEVKVPQAAVEAPAKAWDSLSKQGKRTVIVMREWLPGSSASAWRDSKQRKYFDGLVPNTDALFNAEPDYDVQLASYQQSSDGDPEPPPLPPPAGGAEGAAPTEPPEEPIGEAPPDTRQVFLRSATVLLNPGDVQFDWGLEYELIKNDRPVIVSGNVLDEEEVRDRQLYIPFAARLGITRRIQAYVQTPIGWGQSERVDSTNEVTDEEFNIGDVSAGANIVLRQGHGQGPDVIGTLGFSAPTGPDPYADQITVASLGSGFWTLQGSLLWIHSYDPVVVFYGFGYRHYFERSHNGLRIAPGEEVTYNCGMGFAINDRITVSSAFQGSYISEWSSNGTTLSGSDTEPMSLRFALTAITSPCHIIEPFIRFGLTDDAADSNFGVVVTRSF